MLENINQWDLNVLVAVRSWSNPQLALIASIASLLSWRAATVWLAIPVIWLKGKRHLAVEIFSTLFTCAIIGMICKELICRPRPSVFAAVSAGEAMPDYLKTQFSFPSGHVLLIAALATLLWKRGHYRWSAGFWAFSAIVAWSRLYVGEHWPSDLIGSLLIGVTVAFAVATFYKTRLGEKTHERIDNLIEVVIGKARGVLQGKPSVPNSAPTMSKTEVSSKRLTRSGK